MAAYQLAEGYNNAAGFVAMSSIVVDDARLAQITSLGTYETARELDTLDGGVRDDGYDQFTWTFEFMLPSEVDYIRDTFLDGNRSGPVTVETRDNQDNWVQVNAVLRLPKTYVLRGEYYGPVVFQFTSGEALA